MTIIIIIYLFTIINVLYELAEAIFFLSVFTTAHNVV